MHTVAVVVYDRVAVFEMGVPCEVFGIDRSAMGLPNYRTLVCAAEPGPLTTAMGYGIEPQYGIRSLARADTIVVPSWRDVGETPPEPLLRALRSAHRRGARIASLCAGAFVLAHAGLLDGRRATTHWMFADALASRFPQVDVDPTVLYIDEGSILTSAGTASGIDLCLHMVRKDHGAEVANAFARRMVVPPHRDGGQAQFVQTPMPTLSNGNHLAATMEWALEHMDESLTVEQLAAHAHRSSRTFARHFRAETGTTPLQWLLAQRILAAQRMLETTDEPVSAVAIDCGFGSSASLRVHFGRVLGTSPASYRRTFRAQALPSH
ncbi:MAG: helix-turn-helix domain-containing protein [Actinomycetota bacterium]|nr:helix-turn-helix domain-containing protein [Actinomycetota bacterium]